MEDKISWGASRPPKHPKLNSSTPLPPFRMMFPSTLARAFENSSPGDGDGDGDGENGKSVAISPKAGVDLNIQSSPRVTLDAEGEGTYKSQIDKSPTPPSISKMCQINQDEEAGFSHMDKRIMTLDEAIQHEKNGRDLSLEDERKLRRTVSNRLSAQRSRLKRTQYIDELLKKIKELQNYVASLTPELESYKQRQKMLKMQKTTLEQQLEYCINQSALCDREIEEKQAEIRRLKYLFNSQKEEMMTSSAAPSAASSTISLPIYPPESESNYQRVLSSNSASFFPSEPPAAVVEVVSSDQGGIEQYLNLDALNVPSSHATDIM